MTCAVCGLGDHRYGTSDPNHDYDAMACVNLLRACLDNAEAEVRRLHKALDIYMGTGEPLPTREGGV